NAAPAILPTEAQHAEDKLPVADVRTGWGRLWRDGRLRTGRRRQVGGDGPDREAAFLATGRRRGEWQGSGGSSRCAAAENAGRVGITLSQNGLQENDKADRCKVQHLKLGRWP